MIIQFCCSYCSEDAIDFSLIIFCYGDKLVSVSWVDVSDLVFKSCCNMVSSGASKLKLN